MTLLLNDPLSQLTFSVYENKGVFAVLLGSGLSRSAQIPTGWEITLDLVRRVAMSQGVDEQPDWATWRSEEHTSELQSLMRISYAVFFLKKTKYYLSLTTSTTIAN